MLEQEMKRTLKDLGIRPDLKGYWYIIDAMQYMLADGDFMSLKTMNIYTAVSKQRGQSRQNIERCIRHAIERMYDTCETDAIADVLGKRTNIWNGKLTNKEFLWTLAEHFSDVAKTMETSA